MIKQSIAEIEEYSETGFAVKKLYKGAQSEAVVMHLKSGQMVPSHPHDRFEVTLLPQKGQAILTIDGEESAQLLPGVVYHESAGKRFGIVNDGDENFQMIVVLVQAQSTPASKEK